VPARFRADAAASGRGLARHRLALAGDPGPVRRPRSAQRGRAAAPPAVWSAEFRAGRALVVGDPNTVVVDKGATTQTILAVPEGDGQEARTSTPQ
jgi:hypothetical protein